MVQCRAHFDAPQVALSSDCRVFRPRKVFMSHPPFIAAQIQSLIEDIRLLEAFVTAPLGLYSDVKMLREALPFPEASELERSQQQERRLAYRNMTEDPPATALAAVAHARASVHAAGAVVSNKGPVLNPEWTAQAETVLARVERQVAGTVRSKLAARLTGVYVIVDPEATNGRPVAEVTKAALRGGVRVIQLRDKHGDKAQMLDAAREIKSLCDEHEALFITNDHADLALASEAHGLHVGQTDLPVQDARSVLEQTQIIGKSNNGVEEAVSSEAEGADYVAVGAVFATSTMDKSNRTPVGPETIERVKSMVEVPVVAIGGINASNIEAVVKAGADSVCVVSAVTLAADPAAAARELSTLAEEAK